MNDEIEFEYIIADLISNPMVQQMAHFRHHCTTSCLEHCKHVAFYNYLICKKLKLDYMSAARAGILHDFFFFFWRKKQIGSKKLHAFCHPRIALNNAQKLFNINKKEKDIILKHMWPLTIIPPKYIESYIITIVDKYCTLFECYTYYKSKIRSNA